MKYISILVAICVVTILFFNFKFYKEREEKRQSKTYNEWKEASISYTLDHDTIISYYSSWGGLWIKYPKWQFRLNGIDIVHAIDSSGIDQMVGSINVYGSAEHRIKEETYNRLIHIRDSILVVIKNTPIPEKWERVCNYEVRGGYKLVYNKRLKKYAIKSIKWPTRGWFLVDYGSFGIQSFEETIVQPTMFDDSCIAKGFYKAFKEGYNTKLSREFK